MLAGGGVSPFAGGALSAVRSCEANEQAAAWRVGNVADDPIATAAAAVGEVAAAHRLGITRENSAPDRQLVKTCRLPGRLVGDVDERVPLDHVGQDARSRRQRARTGAASMR